MERDALEAKLTPAAKQALQELMEDFRAQVLRGAAQSAAAFQGEVREITVRDIVASSTQNLLGARRWRATGLEWVLNSYAILGAVFGIASVFYTLYLRDSAPSVQRIALQFSIMGMSLALFATLLLIIRNRRLRRQMPEVSFPGFSYSVGELGPAFVMRWPQLELALRSMAAVHLGESSATAPIGLLIQELSKKGTLTMEDASNLRSLLEIRNRVLHEGVQLSRDEYDSAIKRTEAIIQKASAPV